MNLDKLLDVSGYWLGPPVWFGSARSEPLALPGIPGQHLCAYRRILENGVEVVVTQAGLVLMNFAQLPPEDPTSRQVAGAPFADDPHLVAASLAAPRRVEILNAHQLCLLSAIGTRESEEDIWSPEPRPVSVPTLWTGVTEDPVTIPSTEVRAYFAFLTETSTVLRTMFTFPPEVLDRSFTTFEGLLAVPIATRVCHGLLHAADHYRHWRFDQALILAWSGVEELLNIAWENHFTASAAAHGHKLNKERRDLLTGRDFSNAVVLESLALAGVLDPELYADLSQVRRARNRWAHGLDPVTANAASTAIGVGLQVLDLVTGVQLDVPFGLPSPNL